MRTFLGEALALVALALFVGTLLLWCSIISAALR
jgi:hypothetical protein